MPGFNAQACGDGYTAACTLEGVWSSVGGWFSILGAGVALQVQYGTPANPIWGKEQQVGVGSTGGLPGTATGIRFRNAVSGQVATVTALIGTGGPRPTNYNYEAEPVLSINAGSAAAVAAAYTIVGQGHKNGTNGTATVLNVSLACAGVVVRAKPDNTGLVYVGKSTVTTSNGYELSPGDAVGMDVGNANSVFFDVDVTGEGVSWAAVG